MHRLLPALILSVATLAHASWQADLESGGGDAVGMILAFWALVAFVAARKGFQKN